MTHELELRTALEAANRAAVLILEHYEQFQAIPDAPASITTAADRASQEIILQHLHEVFPGDALRAEEGTPTLQSAPDAGRRLWIVDPIDGTRGFARKNGEFAVMIAFVLDGQPTVGVVQEPAQGRLTYAVRGGGCWKCDTGEAGPTPCRVGAAPDLAHAVLTKSHPFDPAKPSRGVQLLGPARVMTTYSAGVKLALVARGEADLYLNSYDSCKDWDICAGEVLVQEAGGKVTNLKGDRLVYGLPSPIHRDGVLASNGKLHDAALVALRAAC